MASLPQPATSNSKPNAFNWHLRNVDRGSLSASARNHFIAAVGEFVGTTLFLMLAFGSTNVAQIPDLTTGTAIINTSSLLYISLAFGFSLATVAWVFFRVSGGLFNPAVSLGLCVVGAITPLRACILTVSQILGGITAAAIVQALTPGPLFCRTSLSFETSVAQGLFIEMFMTAVLMLTIFLLAAEKHKATFLAPIGIGLALFVCEMFSVAYTGGSLNPARSFGPSVVVGSFYSYHWIYWLGPILGSLLAAGFYKFIKYMQYESVVAGQDDDGSMAVAQRMARRSDLKSGSKATLVPPPPTRLGETKMVSQHELVTRPGMGTRVSTFGRSGEGNVAIQGPGIGDLLTTTLDGDAGTAAAFDLPAASNPVYDARLDHMDAKLDQLLAAFAAQSTRGGTSGAYDRRTLVEEPDFDAKDKLAIRESEDMGERTEAFTLARNVDDVAGQRGRDI